ncbi:jg14627 [Pararge aegeria aegeria]|uniref:Jg14627 protein n=1 Tax=Pararge aegeria aegeria TaxID=348720 RepID=A0A8S4RYA7_9NEOP|nr:jg14627 [Pararge aegeria aegeria]
MQILWPMARAETCMHYRQHWSGQPPACIPARLVKGLSYTAARRHMHGQKTPSIHEEYLESSIAPLRTP